MFFPPPRPEPAEPAEPAEPESPAAAGTAYAFQLVSEGLELDAVQPRLMSDLGLDAHTATRCVEAIRALRAVSPRRVPEAKAVEQEASVATAGAIGSVIGALLLGAFKFWSLENGSSSGGFIKAAVAGAVLGGLAGCWLARNFGSPERPRRTEDRQ